MAFGLGGLLALSSAGKFPKTYQEYQERQFQLDEEQRGLMTKAAMGNALKLYGDTPSTGQGGMIPQPPPMNTTPNYGSGAMSASPGEASVASPPPPPPPGSFPGLPQGRDPRDNPIPGGTAMPGMAFRPRVRQGMPQVGPIPFDLTAGGGPPPQPPFPANKMTPPPPLPGTTPGQPGLPPWLQQIGPGTAGYNPLPGSSMPIMGVSGNLSPVVPGMGPGNVRDQAGIQAIGPGMAGPGGGAPSAAPGATPGGSPGPSVAGGGFPTDAQASAVSSIMNAKPTDNASTLSPQERAQYEAIGMPPQGFDWKQLIRMVYQANPGIDPVIAASTVSSMFKLMEPAAKQEWLVAHNNFLTQQLGAKLASQERVAAGHDETSLTRTSMQGQYAMDRAQLAAHVKGLDREQRLQLANMTDETKRQLAGDNIAARERINAAQLEARKQIQDEKGVQGLEQIHARGGEARETAGVKGDIVSRQIGERGRVQTGIQELRGTQQKENIKLRGDIAKDLQEAKKAANEELAFIKGDIRLNLQQQMDKTRERLQQRGFDQQTAMQATKEIFQAAQQTERLGAAATRQESKQTFQAGQQTERETGKRERQTDKYLQDVAKRQQQQADKLEQMAVQAVTRANELKQRLDKSSEIAQKRIDAMLARGKTVDAQREADRRSREEQQEHNRVAAEQRNQERIEANRQNREFAAAQAEARRAANVAFQQHKIDIRPDMNSLSDMTKNYDAVEAFSKLAKQNGDVLMELANKKDITGLPMLERWINAGRREVGDDEIAKFGVQMRAYKNEIARILAQPRMTGVLTEGARKEFDHVLPESASAPQIRGVVQLLNSDAVRRRQSYIDQVNEIHARLAGGPMGGEPAEGTVATSPGKPPLVYRNHQWVPQ